MATATRPMVRIHDTATDKIVDRQMNDAEYAQYQSDIAAKEAQQAAIAAKEAASVSAVAKLEAIGLTADEIAALRG